MKTILGMVLKGRIKAAGRSGNGKARVGRTSGPAASLPTLKVLRWTGAWSATDHSRPPAHAANAPTRQCAAYDRTAASAVCSKRACRLTGHKAGRKSVV